MDTALFDYDLPPEAIAQVPTERRDHSRVMFVDRQTGAVSEHSFFELPHIVRRRTAFIRNNAKVLRARIFGHRPSGGAVECLLLHPGDSPESWWCLLKPGKRLPVGATFGVEDVYQARVLEISETGERRIEFEQNRYGDVISLTEAQGKIPLPPYIHRETSDPRDVLDAERYNTIYADPEKSVAAAAPTAGLHFSDGLLDELNRRGHRFFDLTLHVGLDTFRPIQSDSIEGHRIHRETYEVPIPTQKQLLQPTEELRTLAVGTTALRACEDFHRKMNSGNAIESAFVDAAELFIYPPSDFRIEALLTNFHLPRSTLMCLVSAFLTPGSTDGISWLKEIYRSALDRGFRFYSYGDAMLIL